MLLPFSNAVVPSVDLRGGRVVIELPEEIQGDDRADDDADLSPRRPPEGGDRKTQPFVLAGDGAPACYTRSSVVGSRLKAGTTLVGNNGNEKHPQSLAL